MMVIIAIAFVFVCLAIAAATGIVAVLILIEQTRSLRQIEWAITQLMVGDVGVEPCPDGGETSEAPRHLLARAERIVAEQAA